MSRFTIFVYEYFKRRKTVFYAVLTLTSVFFAWFAGKLRFEEDLSQLLPSIKENGVERFAFSSLKVKDKVFLLFTGASPDELVEACDEFTQTLVERDSTHSIITDVFCSVDDDMLLDGINFLYDNAPVFLDESKYPALDSLLSTVAVERQMEENYATLTSVAGASLRDVITRDPIALRKVFAGGANSFGGGSALGGNFRLYANHFFTPDTTVLIAFIAPNFRALDSHLSTVLVDMLEQEVERFRANNPHIEILYHGAPVQSVSNADRIRQDVALTVSISLIIILTLLLFCFRNKSALLHLLAPVVYGTLFAMATMYFIKGSMSIMAIGIGAIVLGVAFSYCLHMICHSKYVGNTARALKDQTVPVTLGSLTTIGAFIGLLLTDSELLHDFGLFASLALAGTTVFALLFLPQFFRADDCNRKSKKAFALLERINSYPFEKNKWLIALICLICPVCFIASGSVKFDPNLRNIGYLNAQLVRSHSLLASKTAGNNTTFYFAATAGTPDSAFIGSLNLSCRLDSLLAAGDIAGYSAPSLLFVPQAEQLKRIRLWNTFWNDERKADLLEKVRAAAEKHRFAETTFEPFADLLDGDYQPVELHNAEILPEALLSNIIEQSNNRWLVFTPVLMRPEQLWETGRKITGKGDYLALDPMFYASDMVEAIGADFNTTLAVSSIFVLIVLLLAFGNPLITLLAFLPMALSWYIVLGIMSMSGISFNLINIIVSSFIFGVGVDYSIFVMDGLLEQYRTRRPLLVYHKSAIFFSAIILIIVIVSLLFAVHPAIRSIGTATLTGMVATILISYTLQPFLFNLLINARASKGSAPVALTSLLCRRKSLRRAIRNNYLYKGNSIERRLRRELDATANYALLNEMLANKTSILDYGCGYGFTAYCAALANTGIDITGVDDNSETLAIANNCYMKTDRMSFCADMPNQNNFDIVIINKSPDERTLTAMLAGTRTLVVRRSLNCPITGFNKYKSDKIYTVYIAGSEIAN
jgi:predicted RND superfamily exporter protein